MTEQLRPEQAERPLEEKKSTPIHEEAFRLMLFVSRDWSIVETIWNSRDGATPFKVLARDGRTTLTQALWGGDPYAPFHIPDVGDRIFVDMEPEEAQRNAEKTVARWWDDPRRPMRLEYATREDAIAAVRATMDKPGTPALQIVDPKGQKSLLHRRADYGQRLKRAMLDKNQGIPSATSADLGVAFER